MSTPFQEVHVNENIPDEILGYVKGLIIVKNLLELQAANPILADASLINPLKCAIEDLKAKHNIQFLGKREVPTS